MGVTSSRVRLAFNGEPCYTEQFRVTRSSSRDVGSPMMAGPSASVTKKVATDFLPLKSFGTSHVASPWPLLKLWALKVSVQELLVWEDLLVWDSKDTYSSTVSKEICFLELLCLTWPWAQLADYWCCVSQCLQSQTPWMFNLRLSLRSNKINCDGFKRNGFKLIT